MTPDGVRVRPDLLIPEDELHTSISRSGGPGGQHVNKTSSRVTLRWSVTESGVLSDAQRARLMKNLAARLTQAGELVLHADTERSQSRNRDSRVKCENRPPTGFRLRPHHEQFGANLVTFEHVGRLRSRTTQ